VIIDGICVYESCICLHLGHVAVAVAAASALPVLLAVSLLFVCNTLLQHTATHCNTLQHTATHFNTLQHTAIRCNTLHNSHVCVCDPICVCVMSVFLSYLCLHVYGGVIKMDRRKD